MYLEAGARRPLARAAAGILTALLGLGSPPDAAAQAPVSEHTVTYAPGDGPPAATLTDAAWIEGHWVGRGLGGRVEEGGSLVLKLKHFDPALSGWEGRDEFVSFGLVAFDDDTLWFDGLTMARTGPDALTVWVAMEGRDGGVSEGAFAYRRR
jgi:hypothetical protein